MRTNAAGPHELAEPLYRQRVAAQVIVLNGGSSAGKSSLARALQVQVPRPWLVFGTDVLGDALPASGLAAFERALVLERTLAGLAAARARGRVGGRPPTMTADKLAVACQLLAAGQSKTHVAATIGVSRPTLYEHLARHAR